MATPNAPYGELGAIAAGNRLPIPLQNGTLAYTIENDSANPLYVGFDNTVTGTHYWRQIPPGGICNVTMTTLGGTPTTNGLWVASPLGAAAGSIHRGATS